MKIAIMQPYLFPYPGYFQLIKYVDTFVIYEDVSFIKQGWINRNNILVNGKKFLFSVPLKNVSSFKAINQTKIDGDRIEKWKNEFFKTIKLNYSKAPYFTEFYPIIKNVFESGHILISELAISAINSVCSYLNLNTQIVSSVKYENTGLSGENRLIDICRKENGDQYINAIGGTDLYSKDNFRANGIELLFIKQKPIIYEQYGKSFEPMLSVIDMLMFNSPEKANELLNQFELI